MEDRLLKILLLICLVFLFLFFSAGCSPEPVITDPPLDIEEENDHIEEENNDETEEVEPPKEKPVDVSAYYWPYLNLGNLFLSSGEFVPSPDIFESDPGFIAEFTPGYSYKGRLVWLVEDTDVFVLEWVTLLFDVEFFEHNEWVYELNFDFLIEDFDLIALDTVEEGFQQFELDLSERQENFEVTIHRIMFGKGQESSFFSDPINYVALEIEMVAVENP